MTDEHTDRAQTLLGPILKRVREARGLTQLELGHAAGYSGRSAIVTISRIEQGQSLPRLVSLFRLADALQVQPHNLLDPTFQVSEGMGSSCKSP